MIEHLQTIERHCAMCGVLKPLLAFSPCKTGGSQGRHSYCKECRSKTNNAARARKAKCRRNKPMREEIWPRPLMQSLLDVGCKKWARNVETNPRFGVAMIGGGYV